MLKDSKKFNLKVKDKASGQIFYIHSTDDKVIETSRYVKRDADGKEIGGLATGKDLETLFVPHREGQ
jgi:hypothetical protein